MRLVCRLFSDVQPLPSRKARVPLPVPRIASQYFVPDVTAAPGIGILFQAPGVNRDVVACEINVPGWPPESV